MASVAPAVTTVWVATPACAARRVRNASCSAWLSRWKDGGVPAPRYQMARHALVVSCVSWASRPKTFTTSSPPSASTASTTKSPDDWRSAAPSERTSMPSSASATLTSPRAGRPLLEPISRCTTAAARSPASHPAIAAPGVAPSTSAVARTSAMISHRPSRRAGRVRWGAAVARTATSIVRRIEGYHGSPGRVSTHTPASGQPPSTACPTSSETPAARTAPMTRSPTTPQRRRTSATTTTTAVQTMPTSRISCQSGSSADGTASRNVARSRSKPAGGWAARLNPSRAMPEASSTSRSEARALVAGGPRRRGAAPGASRGACRSGPSRLWRCSWPGQSVMASDGHWRTARGVPAARLSRPVRARRLRARGR